MRCKTDTCEVEDYLLARQPIPQKYHDKPKRIGIPVADLPSLAELIGMCVDAATKLEIQLSLTMGSLLGVENAASVAVFASLRNSRARLEALEAAVTCLDDDDQSLFLPLLKQYRSLDGQRNDIVHGVWGQIDGVEDKVLWCSTQTYAVWHISDYHKGKIGTLSSEWRKEQFTEGCKLWPLKDLGAVIMEIEGLQTAIRNFSGYIRYRDQPAGKNAKLALQNYLNQ